MGLAGSSAIIVATLRALMKFYDIDIPLPVQPSLVLSVEQRELAISAGLQDRVIQVYEGAVYMDFSENTMQEINGYRCGVYQSLDPTTLPDLYIAYSTDFSEPTEAFHNNLRLRYDTGEDLVVTAMSNIAELADKAYQLLVEGNKHELTELLDRNFDLRLSMCRLPHNNVKMVNRARKVGASAKFAGSGGAIIGTYDGDAMYAELSTEMTKIGCRTIQPIIVAM